MDHAANVGAVGQDPEVNENLGGLPPLARELIPLEIEENEIAGLHEAFADHRRRGQNAAVGQAISHVAGIGFHVLELPETRPDLAQLFAGFFFGFPA